MALILGLNAYHADAAACLLMDGKVIAAAEEERFRRIKHWAGFPSQAIRFCLDAAGASIADVSAIAINSNPSANFMPRVGYALRRISQAGQLRDRFRNHRNRLSIMDDLVSAFPQCRFRGKVVWVEHHAAHLASAFLASPFDSAVAVSLDAFGDFASTAWGVGRGAVLDVGGQIRFPHSLGIFYQALTQYLGFRHHGDEYKVMGLAPYGTARFAGLMRDIVRRGAGGGFRLNLAFFRHHREHVPYVWEGGSPEVGALFSPALEALLGPARSVDAPLDQRHCDIARSTQELFEETLFHLLNALHERYRIDCLALAGGCAMNSVANGKIRSRTPFRHIYIPPAAGDAGGAIGAALHVSHGLSKARRRKYFMLSRRVPAIPRCVMNAADLGPEFSADIVGAVLERHQASFDGQSCRVYRVDGEDALCQHVAATLAEGGIVGWFQGRMEWGPRALGHRSILADPRRADIREILNEKIKRRESFRPFAPSILREDTAAWFEIDADVPFMSKVFRIRAEKRPLVPAVAHVDGSGRLQTVSRSANPRFWKLIDTFRALTGVPLVLNTSFNENEPVVCKPEEALDCFLRTRMDLLVLGDWVVERCRQSLNSSSSVPRVSELSGGACGL